VLNPKQHPIGTRFLYAGSTFAGKDQYIDAIEATVLEWSSSGQHVKIHEPQYNRDRWINAKSKYTIEPIELLNVVTNISSAALRVRRR
jgi:hypothetical protein